MPALFKWLRFLFQKVLFCIVQLVVIAIFCFTFLNTLINPVMSESYPSSPYPHLCFGYYHISVCVCIVNFYSVLQFGFEAIIL